MSDVLVSFVIPVYNGKKYIEDCVKSIEHNIGDYEILLIDDGSTDGSSEICDNMARKFTNIIVIHNKNHGVSFSRNLGIKKSSGKYVAFVDQDDYITADFVETCENIDSYEPDAIYFKWKGTNIRHDTVKRDVSPNIIMCSRKERIELVSNLLHCIDNKYSGYTLVFPWGGLYKKDFLAANNIEFNPEVLICEDVYFNIAVLKTINTVLLCDSVKYFYFNNIVSAGKGFNEKAAEIGVKSNQLIKNELGDLYDNPQIEYCYEYSVVYRYWWAVIANYYHIKNKQSIIERAHDLQTLYNNEMYLKAFGYVDDDMLNRMDKNMRIVIELIKHQKFILASIVCKARILVKKLRMVVNQGN